MPIGEPAEVLRGIWRQWVSLKGVFVDLPRLLPIQSIEILHLLFISKTIRMPNLMVKDRRARA